MTSVVRRPTGALFPEIWDLFEASWPFSTRHPIHIEDFVEEGAYVVRAELPGLDVAKDVDVSATNGVLTIKAKREETTRQQHRTEFHYGSFTRAVTLPAGADAEHISAKYEKGVLEVRVPRPAAPEEHKIEIDVQPEQG